MKTYWGYREAEVVNRITTLPRIPELEKELCENAGVPQIAKIIIITVLR